MKYLLKCAILCYNQVIENENPALRRTAGIMSERYRFGTDSIPLSVPQTQYRFGHSKKGCLMATSKLQRKVSFALSTHFGEFTIRENSRPDWCRGPNYERLELDFWIEELDVAIEVQGQQHYVYTPHFHASYDDFKAQQARDEAKKRKCADYRILLLEISDQLTYNKALEVVYDRAKAEQATVPTKRISKKFERKFDHLCQMYRDFCEASDSMSDGQYKGKAEHLYRQSKDFTDRHGIRTIRALSDEKLSILLGLISRVETRLEIIRGKVTLASGFYPGEEIIWLYQPFHQEDLYYEHKGFVVYANRRKAIIDTITPKGRMRRRTVSTQSILSADHLLFDAKLAARSCTYLNDSGEARE